GDWALHCHKSHHTMNAMGHEVKTFIGVQTKDLVKRVRRHVPDYMAMGNAGMADMGEMEMPMPDNTLPMMTGFGQFGPMEMGGMFTVVKVRDGLAPGDYRDPGPYKNPERTVAWEYKGEVPEPARQQQGSAGKPGVEMNVVKPGSNAGHSGKH
ncbi:MAG: copper oxidase, partial [Gammaproteobacteria bacterium]